MQTMTAFLSLAALANGQLNTTFTECASPFCEMSIGPASQKLFSGFAMNPGEYMHASFSGVAGHACAIALDDSMASVVSMAMKSDAYTAFKSGACSWDNTKQELVGTNCVAFKQVVSAAGHISLTILSSEYDSFDMVSYNFGSSKTTVTLGHYHTS